MLLFSLACSADAEDAAAPDARATPEPPSTHADANTNDTDTNVPDASAPLEEGGADPTDASAAADVTAENPSVRFLTYNVGGLADFLSAGKPSVTTPQISPKLNPFDLVVVQEDFSYHDKLVAQISHEYVHVPGKASLPKVYGDGLALFSRLRILEANREEWGECHGLTGNKNDCLAKKGFVHLRIEIAPDVLLDVYDLHMDAGRDAGDVSARDQQTTQLASYIAAHSVDRPIVLAGDTNMKEGDEASLARLIELTGLRDVCRELACPQPYLHDRVLLRDANDLHLWASDWHIDESFVDAQGQPLSDHGAVAIDLHWRR